MQCVICKQFLPPGFTEPIPDTKYHKCKFCQQSKNMIMSINHTDNSVHWDVKERIVQEYKEYLNHLVRNKEARGNLIKGTKV